MYEMLIGKAPFTGEKAAVIMIKQVNHPLPSIKSERVDVPQSLENIVIKATAKKLNNRYKDVTEMLVDLETALSTTRENEEKLILKNDVISDDAMGKTVLLNDELNYNNLKNESQKIEANKKKKKMIIGIFAGAISLLMLFVLFFNKPSVMPDLIGKNQSEITQELALLNIKPENITLAYEYSEDVEENLIIQTEPKEGTKINSNDKIIITISKGKEQLRMENYVNKIGSVAKRELEELGFKDVKLEEVDSELAEGVVVSQSVQQGEIVDKNQTIILKVSNGNYKVTIPNFKGLTLQEVISWATPYGIEVETTYVCDNSDKGTTVSQEPKYGVSVKNKSKIKIVISDGKCESV